MAPRRALQNILGHKKWVGLFSKSAPACKISGAQPLPPTPFAPPPLVGVEAEGLECTMPIIVRVTQLIALLNQLALALTQFQSTD